MNIDIYRKLNKYIIFVNRLTIYNICICTFLYVNINYQVIRMKGLFDLFKTCQWLPCYL